MMAKSQDGKVRRKKPRRRARRARRRPGPVLAVLAILLLIVAVGAVGYFVFDDRHWHAFDAAGDAALARGNYAYAERMYGQALQVASELGEARLVAATLTDLSRVYAAQGRGDEARDAAQRAQQSRGPSRR